MISGLSPQLTSQPPSEAGAPTRSRAAAHLGVVELTAVDRLAPLQVELVEDDARAAAGPCRCRNAEVAVAAMRASCWPPSSLRAGRRRSQRLRGRVPPSFHVRRRAPSRENAGATGRDDDFVTPPRLDRVDVDRVVARRPPRRGRGLASTLCHQRPVSPRPIRPRELQLQRTRPRGSILNLGGDDRRPRRPPKRLRRRFRDVESSGVPLRARQPWPSTIEPFARAAPQPAVRRADSSATASSP